MVVSRGIGRADYSQTVNRIYETMPKTITSPLQANYHWSSSFSLSKFSYITATLSTVGSNTRTSILHARFSVPQNTLLEAHLLINGLSFAQGYGYGTVDIPVPNGFVFAEGQVIGIKVTNWNTVDDLTVRYYVQGVDETVVQ
ncbi:MAG: hypothetical protein KAJ24_03210 [Candidatus Aenigmarchaeota archaeon]|nr:hypothetical protein [Candidatus Aenigmarchaeota archaeon]